MAERCLALCPVCGKVWTVTATGNHEEWRISPILPEYITRMAPQPVAPTDVLRAIMTGKLEVNWAAVTERRSFLVAASEPFCPDDGATFSETYAHDTSKN